MTELSPKLLIHPSRWSGRIFGLLGQSVLVLSGSLLAGALLLAHRPWPIEGFTVTAMVLVSLVAMILSRFHIRHTNLGVVDHVTAERMIGLVGLLTLAGVQLTTRSLGRQDLMGMGFLLTAPLVAQAMLVSALIGPAVSLFALTLVTLLLGVSGAVGMDVLVASWLAGAVGAHAVNPLKRRSDLVRATTIQVACQAAIACSVSAVTESDILAVLTSAGWAAIAAVGATSIFWLAVTVLERVFGVISDWSLLELCSPEHPLIRELCLRAPGTYAHSVMVGNLAENAARELGANPVHCRAMAYFHDIGKLERPSYFIENQGGENVHDELSPSLSAKVIAAHVADGLALGKKHHLPRILLDGIAQHHGTTLITFFFHRARQLEPERENDPSLEQQYRYDGPRPQTRDAAILLLADSVEAVHRAMGPATSEELEIMVARVIEERRADGQFDECDLTFRDLQTLKKAFLHSLCALRHERVPYPEADGPETAHPASHLDLQSLQAPRGNGTHPKGDGHVA